jgi:lipopolysaccharide transport system ATP-binding protein
MSDVIIKVEELSKQYRLGQVGTGMLAHDINRWWHRIRGKDNPYLKIGEENDRSQKGTSDYVWALKDINFQVRRGEVLGIIGRNGAGKSTLLKILSRTTTPSTGTVKVKGRIASLLEVGTGFHPELSGRDNIFLNGAILGMTRQEIKRKFDEIVDFSGVDRYIDTPVKRYSSGMYVRLAFAVAAHLDPEILIVDEVLAVGDSEFQKKCLGKMKDVSDRDGRTVLFVSHNMAAINTLCSKGLVLQNGTIKKDGSTGECVKLYLTENQTFSRINLADRKDRTGNGLFRFEEIVFLDKDFNARNNFLSGNELNIQIKYKTLNDEPLRNVSISMGIKNSMDMQLTVVSNEYSGAIFESLPPEGTIICKIPRLPLLGDTFSLNLFSRVNGEISDWIMNACVLEIETGDYYNTGKITDTVQSLFLMDYNFSLRKLQ